MTNVELTPIQASVLALAIQRRLYGYEVANLLEQGVCRTFLKPAKTAAYSALGRLQDLGYITTDAEDFAQHRQVSKRRWGDHRRWYRATPDGLDAYERWVTGKIEDEPERATLLARIAIAARLGTEGLRKILQECEALCDERERALDALRTRKASSASIGGLCERLVIAERRIALAGTREWIDLAREEIKAHERRTGEEREQATCRPS